MTIPAIEVLHSFENLQPEERSAVLAEIARRAESFDEICDDDLASLANETFLEYDARKSAAAAFLSP